MIATVHLATGVAVQYREQGEATGIPVIMLHGITDSLHSFDPVMPHLPAGIHAFALTQRGHGDADRPQNGYRTRDFAADVAAFMDAVGISSAIIVGHSMGATNAQRFAIDHPHRVSGLVLAAAFASFADKPWLVDYIDSTVHRLTDPVDVAIAVEFQRSTLAQPVPQSFFDRLVRETLKVPARVWRQAFDGLLEDDVTASLGAIGAPTLLTWGDQDTLAPRRDQEIMLAAIASSSLAVYAGTGHAVHWEKPRRFARELLAFAERIAR